MKSKSITGIVFLLFVVSVFVKQYIRMEKRQESEPPAPVEMSETAADSTESVSVQEVVPDTFYLPAPSYKIIGNRTWTANNLGILIVKKYNEWDTLGVMGPTGGMFSWMEALEACPSGFRIPRKEEFQGRNVDDLGVGVWWTSNIANMYTTERPVKDSEYPEREYHVLAKVAQVSGDGRPVKITETNIQEKHSVLCISDTSESIEKTLSDMPDKITTTSGAIMSVKFEPHYSSEYGCADCCCGEGNGGVIEIQFKKNDGTVGTETVYEIGEYNLCVPPEFLTNDQMEESENGGMEPLDTTACTKPEKDNLNLLSLFRKGAYIESKRCEYSVYVKAEVDGAYISGRSCGDTLKVSFTGVLKDIQPVSGEKSTLCTYKILYPETDEIITTTHECKGVMIGSTYRIKGTVTYTDNAFERVPPVLYMTYPCCEGRGDSRGDEYSRLDFELVEE